MNKNLVSVRNSPIIIADLIDNHYHKERVTEREDMSIVLDFKTARMFFGLALRDALKCNMNLGAREQVKKSGCYFTVKQ